MVRDQMIKIGIIGTGGIVDDCHIPAIKSLKEISLHAVFSRTRENSLQMLKRHSLHSVKVHETIEDFVADNEIDCAIISSPDRVHAQQALACLKNGKDVLLEKPMAISKEEAELLVRTVEEHKRILAIGFHLRFHKGHQALYEAIVHRKEIGELRHICAIWAIPQKDNSNWRAHDELGKWWSLAAVGAHCIDLARWFSNDFDDWAKFSSITSHNIWNSKHDEAAIIAGQFMSGANVSITSSVQFGHFDRLELFGSAGQAICRNTFGRKGAGEIILNDQLLNYETRSPFIGQIEHFLDSVKTRKSPSSDGYVGLRNVKDLVLANQEAL